MFMGSLKGSLVSGAIVPRLLSAVICVGVAVMQSGCGPQDVATPRSEDPPAISENNPSAPDEPGNEVASPAKATSPAVRVELMAEATQGEDWIALFQCFDKASRNELLANALVSALTVADEDKQKTQSLAKITSEYGVDASAFADTPPSAKFMSQVERGNEFFQALIVWQERNQSADSPGIDWSMFTDAELFHVDIDGDRAQGKYQCNVKVVMQTGDEPPVVRHEKQTVPMHFLRQDGNWYVDMLATMRAEVGEAEEPDEPEPTPEKRDVVVQLETPAMLVSFESPLHVNAMVFSPDAKLLAMAYSLTREDSAVGIFDAATGERKWEVELKHQYPASLAFSDDGQQLAVGGSPRTSYSNDDEADKVAAIEIFDATTGDSQQQFAGHTGGVVQLSFHNDGATLISASEDRDDEDSTIRFWNVADGKEQNRIDLGKDVDGVAFSTTAMLATTVTVRTVRVWDLKTGKQASTIDLGKMHNPGVGTIALSANGTTLYSEDYGDLKALWTVKTGTPSRELAPGESFAAPTFTPNSRHLATGVKWEIQLWDVSTLKKSQSFSGHKNFIAALAISPDGKLLASASYDKTIKVWRIEE